MDMPTLPPEHAGARLVLTGHPAVKWARAANETVDKFRDPDEGPWTAVSPDAPEVAEVMADDPGLIATSRAIPATELVRWACSRGEGPDDRPGRWADALARFAESPTNERANRLVAATA